MIARRLALAAAPLLLLLVAAGAYTLATGRSPRAWFVRPAPALQLHFDAEKARAAAALPGPYRSHPDPRVGYVLKRDAEVETGRATARTDELGLRRRAGPAAAAGAKRIVVIGDSVAFGTGVGDADCFPQLLEDEIAALRGDDGERDVICVDAAIPGWNWRNAFAFLRDHAARLRPDRVLFMPIGNDLSDGERASEAGQREVAIDLENGRPRLLANLNRLQQTVMALVPRVERGELRLTEEELGPTALNADLGGESARRHDALADGVAALGRELGGRGIDLALLQYEPNDFLRALQRRLAAAGSPLPWIPLLDEVRPEDTLGDDPHPNAATNRALARWTAAALAERGWFEARHPAPVDAAWAARRAPPVAPQAELERLAALDRAASRALLRAVIEPERGEGLQQVYGGLSPHHVVGAELLAALPRSGATLEVELAPLAGRDDLLPLAVAVEVDGRPVGVVELPASAVAPVRASFPFVPSATARRDGAATETIDVGLLPDRVAVVEVRGGSEVGACRLVRLAVVSE